MDLQHARAPGYVVPAYQAPAGAAWYHFLHGNVPGHQIDFIYRPEVPDGPLTQQHFSHLARLIRYIEPQTNAPFAFSIGNLSRDDVQHEPGHGGVALIIGLRIEGVTDHAGRKDPPFAHGIAAIDRTLDDATLIATAIAFHRHALGGAASKEWYRTYVRHAHEEPGAVPGMLERYVRRFTELPEPAASIIGPSWVTDGAPQPRRIVIVHDDDTAFGEIAVAAARIAAVLYRSDIRWTMISTGREGDIPNGVSIRLLARRDLGPADVAGIVHELRDLPDDAAGLAQRLFAATPVVAEERPEPRSGVDDPTLVEDAWVDVEVDLDFPVDETPSTPAAVRTPAAPDPSPAPPADRAPPSPAVGRSAKTIWWIVGGFCALAAGILALIAMQGRHGAAPVSPGVTSSPAPTAPPARAAQTISDEPPDR